MPSQAFSLTSPRHDWYGAKQVFQLQGRCHQDGCRLCVAKIIDVKSAIPERLCAGVKKIPSKSVITRSRFRGAYSVACHEGNAPPSEVVSSRSSSR